MEWTLEMFFCNVSICHMNMENQGKYSIVNVHSSRTPAVQQNMWLTRAQLSTEQQDWGEVQSFSTSFHLTALVLLLSITVFKSGQPECSPETFTVLRDHCPGIEHLVQVFMS